MRAFRLKGRLARQLYSPLANQPKSCGYLNKCEFNCHVGLTDAYQLTLKILVLDIEVINCLEGIQID